MIPTNCIDKADEDECDIVGGDGGSGDDDVDGNEDDRTAKCRKLFTMTNVRCFFTSVVSINIFFCLARSYLLMVKICGKCSLSSTQNLQRST
jgi:hypothetical protein